MPNSKTCTHHRLFQYLGYILLSISTSLLELRADAIYQEISKLEEENACKW